MDEYNRSRPGIATASKAPITINFRVKNLRAMLAQLRAAGVAVDDKVQEEPYGKFGWVMDPEGNRIELWSDRPRARRELRSPSVRLRSANSKRPRPDGRTFRDAENAGSVTHSAAPAMRERPAREGELPLRLRREQAR